MTAPNIYSIRFCRIPRPGNCSKRYGKSAGEIGTIAGVHIVPSKKIVASGDKFTCPIVKLEPASPETEYTEGELPAVTIFLKKDIQTDAEWKPRSQTHEITTAKYYGVALTNEAKVVKAVFDATPAV